MPSIPLESTYARLGGSLGEGITSALDNLAKAKLESLNRANFNQQWGEAGYKPHEIQMLWEARQNPTMAKGITQLLGAFGQGAPQQEQMQQQQFAPEQYMPEEMGQQQGPMQQQFDPRQVIAQHPGLASLFGQPNASAALMQNPQIAQLLGMGNQEMPNATRQLGLNRLPAEQMQNPTPSGRIPEQAPRPMAGIPGQMPQQMAETPRPMTDRERYAQGGKGSTISDKYQAAIDKSEKKYLDAAKARPRIEALRDITNKAGQMKELLNQGADDGSQVESGWTGAIPSSIGATRILGSASEQFATDADDIAAALTSLQSGVQTISKIRFNQNRKPNLGQNRLTQEERTEELLDYGKRGYLELDLIDYLTDKNGGKTPQNLSGKVEKIYGKLANNIPPVPEWAKNGQDIKDSKNGVIWKVEGPILRFNGFIGE